MSEKEFALSDWIIRHRLDETQDKELIANAKRYLGKLRKID